MLTHHRRFPGRAGMRVTYRNLANPLDIGFRMARRSPAVLFFAGRNAKVAPRRTFAYINQKPPPLDRRGSLIGRTRLGVVGAERVQRDAGDEKRRKNPAVLLSTVRRSASLPGGLSAMLMA